MGSRYKIVYRQIAQDILTELATHYTAYDFFMNRLKIGSQMEKVLNEEYQSRCSASVEFFQLRSVDLPDDFEEAISLTEVHKQDIHKAQAEENKTVIELETKRMMAEFQKNVTINLA